MRVKIMLLAVIVVAVVVALVGCSGEGPMPTGIQGGYWYTNLLIDTQDGSPVATAVARDWPVNVTIERIYFLDATHYRRVFVGEGGSIISSTDTTYTATQPVNQYHWNVILALAWPVTNFVAEILADTPGSMTTTYDMDGHTYVVHWWRTDW
jgi:hypothetical protein